MITSKRWLNGWRLALLAILFGLVAQPAHAVPSYDNLESGDGYADVQAQLVGYSGGNTTYKFIVKNTQPAGGYGIKGLLVYSKAGIAPIAISNVDRASETLWQSSGKYSWWDYEGSSDGNRNGLGDRYIEPGETVGATSNTFTLTYRGNVSLTTLNYAFGVHVVEPYSCDTHFAETGGSAASISISSAPQCVRSGVGPSTFKYVITNTGTKTLKCITVTDAFGTLTCSSQLAPGASVTLTRTATITTSNSTFPNTVTVSAQEYSGCRPVIDSACATVQVVHPALTITKTANASAVTAGTLVTYSYVVKNKGDVAVNNIQVKDDKLGLIGSPFNLAPGATSSTLTKSATLTTDTTNVASASGKDACANTTVKPPNCSVTVQVVTPALSIVKSADRSCVVKGGSVTYTYTVKNTGDVTINNLLVTDDKLGVVGMRSSLAAGVTVSFTKSTTLNYTTTNTSAVSGSESCSGSTKLVPSNSVTVTVVNPSLSIEKTASASAVVAGTPVTYSYVVKNTGDVAINNIQVTDDKLGPIGATFNLAAGATSSTLTKSATLSATTTNIATAAGKETCSNTTVTSPPDTVTVKVVRPALSIVKTIDHDCVVKGGSVTYTYTVKNTGDVAINNLMVTDDQLGPVGTIPSLAMGASTSLTKSASLTVTTTNTAAVSGTDASAGTQVMAPSNSVTVTVVNPGLSIVKTASANTVVAGTLVTYSYVVKNTGDVAINGIQVTDDQLGPIGAPFNLAVGATSSTLTKSATLTATTTNTAAASGKEACSNTTVTSPNDTVTVTVVNPSLTLVKTADHDCVVKDGSVTYTYLVKNTGDVAINDLMVTDDQLGPIGTIPSLAAGATASLTKTTTLTETTTNTGAVSGTDAGAGTQVMASSTPVMVTVVNPALSIVKTASATTVVAGSLVTYSYVVKNTGDVAIDNIQVTDDQLGPIGSPFNLAVGATSSTLTKSATLTATTTNVAVATGADACANTSITSPNSTVTVTVVNPSLSIVKTADHECVVKGEAVKYTYLVKNTGDVAINDLMVTDDQLGLIGTIPSLAAGATTSLTKNTILTETTTNTAAVSGTDAGAGTQVMAASNPVTVMVVNPSVKVSEMVSATLVPYGGSVTCTYEVKNTGDVPLTNITVWSSLNGDAPTSVGTIPVLAPGASQQFTKTMDPVQSAFTDQCSVTSVGGCGEGQAVTHAGPLLEVEVVPAGWTGKVVCGACNAQAGCGIGEAKVQVYRVSDGQPVGAPVTTGTDGSFTLDADLADGQYYLKISAPDYFVTTTAPQTWAQTGPDLTTVVPMTALPVTFRAVELAKGQLFFSDRLGFANVEKGSITGPLTPVGLDAPGAALGQLTNGAFNSAGFTKSYRYFGYIPGYPELGLFTASRPVWVMMNSPLVPADGWNPSSPDTVSFRNSVYVQDGTQFSGTPQANPSRNSQPYFIRILFSHPFDAVGADSTPRGSAYAYSLWLDLGGNPGISGVPQQTHINPGIFSLLDGSAASASTLVPWTVGAGPASSTPGVVPPGWMVQSTFQFRQNPGLALSAFYARGSFKNACGETPSTSPFAIHPDVEPSPDL